MKHNYVKILMGCAMAFIRCGDEDTLEKDMTNEAIVEEDIDANFIKETYIETIIAKIDFAKDTAIDSINKAKNKTLEQKRKLKEHIINEHARALHTLQQLSEQSGGKVFLKHVNEVTKAYNAGINKIASLAQSKVNIPLLTPLMVKTCNLATRAKNAFRGGANQ